MSFMRVVERGDWERFLGEDTSRSDHVSNRTRAKMGGGFVEMVRSRMRKSEERTTKLERVESIYKVEKAKRWVYI